MSQTLQKCEEYIPGEVDIKVAKNFLAKEKERKLFLQGNGISCKIQHYKIWRRVLKERYPDAIVGKQRKNSISSLKQNMESSVKVMKLDIVN